MLKPKALATEKLAPHFSTIECARLFHAVSENAPAEAWNFGVCETRSREPRQARKGATVSGTPRVPQFPRSSSRLLVASFCSGEFLQLQVFAVASLCSCEFLQSQVLFADFCCGFCNNFL